MTELENSLTQARPCQAALLVVLSTVGTTVVDATSITAARILRRPAFEMPGWPETNCRSAIRFVSGIKNIPIGRDQLNSSTSMMFLERTCSFEAVNRNNWRVGLLRGSGLCQAEMRGTFAEPGHRQSRTHRRLKVRRVCGRMAFFLGVRCG